MTQTKEKGFFERYFELEKNHTNVKTEVLAGFTTFVAMAYIIVVNPTMLADPSTSWDRRNMPRRSRTAYSLQPA